MEKLLNSGPFESTWTRKYDCSLLLSVFDRSYDPMHEAAVTAGGVSKFITQTPCTKRLERVFPVGTINDFQVTMG